LRAVVNHPSGRNGGRVLAVVHDLHDGRSNLDAIQERIDTGLCAVWFSL